MAIARGIENILGLTSYSSGIIEVFLRKTEVGQEVTAADFDVAKEEFYKKVCIGLHCPALVSRECSGPKRNVEIHEDNYGMMIAQTDLMTDSQITKQTVKTLKCNPTIFNIV